MLRGSTPCVKARDSVSKRVQQISSCRSSAASALSTEALLMPQSPVELALTKQMPRDGAPGRDAKASLVWPQEIELMQK